MLHWTGFFSHRARSHSKDQRRTECTSRWWGQVCLFEYLNAPHWNKPKETIVRSIKTIKAIFLLLWLAAFIRQSHLIWWYEEHNTDEVKLQTNWWAKLWEMNFHLTFVFCVYGTILSRTITRDELKASVLAPSSYTESLPQIFRWPLARLLTRC